MEIKCLEDSYKYFGSILGKNLKYIALSGKNTATSCETNHAV